MKKLIIRLTGQYLNLLAMIAPRKAGEKGFWLFCTPWRSPLKDHQKRFLDTAEKFTFESDGVTLQAYRWGHGKKNLLFVHGWQSHSFRWKNYIESFSKDEYTLYAFDAPAHGQSGGRYLNLPMYSRAIESFLARVNTVHTVVSHSLGSFAMIYTFFRMNQVSVRRLVITGTPGEVENFLQFYQETLGLSTRTMKYIFDYFSRKLGHMPSHFSARAFARAVRVPVLNIHDELDQETPLHHAVAIHEATEDSKIIVTKGLGHNLKSEEVIRHIVDFVNRPATSPAVLPV